MEFQTTNNTFREMVFPEVDARNEVRICMGYGVKPILISAKVGMDRSTMNNYAEARQAWYEENVTSEWSFLQDELTAQLLPDFDDSEDIACLFDIRKVKALQEDRTKSWERAVNAAKANVIIRDEAREEMGLDAIDEAPVFVGATIRETMTVQGTDTAILDEKPTTTTPAPAQGAVTQTPSPAEMEAQASEEKRFRVFARRRIKEGKAAELAEYEFKFIPPERQRQLLNDYGVPDGEAATVLLGLQEAVRALHPAPAPAINITAYIEPKPTKKSNTGD
jgi:hypothetical protein